MKDRSVRSSAPLSMAAVLIAGLMLTLAGTWRAAAQEATPTAAGEALVRVVHASPDAPAVDVYVDGALAFTGLSFGAATDAVPLPAGDHQVQVTPSGGAPADAVIDATLTLEAGATYQVAATGLLAEIAAQVYEVDRNPLGTGQARVRLVHASPDAPAVDVALAGGDVLIEETSFPAASDYLEVEAGVYDLEVRPTGSTDVALLLEGVEFAAGFVYDLVAIGQVADGTLSALPLSIAARVDCAAVLGIGEADDACVRVVHASPDAPDVDVFVDGERAIEGLAFGDATDYVALAAGDLDVAVVAAGEDEENAVIAATLSLEAGVAYEVAAVGTLDAIAAQVYPVDLTPLPDGLTRARIVHASPDAPAVDVAVTGGDVIFLNAVFPEATDDLEVEGGTFDLEVRPNGSTDVALPLPGVTFEAGTVYSVYAIGLVGDGSLDVLVLTAPLAGTSGATPDAMATPEA